MDFTDGILLVIAVLLAGGLGAFIWQARRRSAETELIRAALYATANSIKYFRGNEPIAVTFDPSVNKAILQLARTGADVQGMIELGSRWMVSMMPPEAIEDMKVPEDWTQAPRDPSSKR